MLKKLVILFWGLFGPVVEAAPGFPTICDVVNTPTFLQSLEMIQSPAICPGPIPRPCVQFSYYVPKYFVEVVSEAKETFFGKLPGVRTQLLTVLPSLPFAAEDDSEGYSFHAHTLNIPFGEAGFGPLPCGGTPPDTMCFSTMSEHLGTNWRTGVPDLWQPKFQAWALSPKGCLLAGAVSSATGGGFNAVEGDKPICSFNLEWWKKYPPSTQPICTGWGIHFPRTGTVTSSDQTTASLVIASRIRSIGAETLKGISISPDEKWQMISPQASSCFREGQNIAILQVKGVGELGRLTGKFKNYLYAIWQRTSCVKDAPWVASTQAWLSTLQSTCKAWR